MITLSLCACGAPKGRSSIGCNACRLKAVAMPVRTCETCSAQFKRKAKGHDALKFCSRVCAGQDKAKRASERAGGASLEDRRVARHKAQLVVFQSRVCAGCVSVFIPRIGTQIFCSVPCGDDAARRAHMRKGADHCTACGKALVYAKGHTRRSFCSPMCRRVHVKGRAHVRAAKRMAKGVRRARTRMVAYEPVDPLVVFARDGWRCQLCGCATPQRLRGTYKPNAPELDHIVPLASKGAHTYANTQCSCRKCNIAKGSKPLGQLRLAV
jgi:5-methylcytosine-specific restriction endonuclease McrA